VSARRAVAAALADGLIAAGEGEPLRGPSTFFRAIEAGHFARRLKALENATTPAAPGS
jgi:hypothetical protein